MLTVLLVAICSTPLPSSLRDDHRRNQCRFYLCFLSLHGSLSTNRLMGLSETCRRERESSPAFWNHLILPKENNILERMKDVAGKEDLQEGTWSL